MNTVRRYPAAKLPNDLRGDIPLDALVTVSIANESHIEEATHGFTQEELDALLAPSIEQKKRGEGVLCETREDFDRYFNDLRAKVDAKYTPK